MVLHFSRVGPAAEKLEIWSASECGFSFVISNESRDGPGLHGKPGFVASWRPIHINKSAIRVGGSPCKTFAEAEGGPRTTVPDDTPGLTTRVAHQNGLRIARHAKTRRLGQ
jgi:hypothetical protein